MQNREKTTTELTPEQSNLLDILYQLLEWFPSEQLSEHLNDMFIGYLDYVTKTGTPKDLSDRYFTVRELIDGFRSMEKILSQQKSA